MFACCVSGFITSNNFKNMVGSVKCAYERIYYDSQYGELKQKETKWEGLKINGKEKENLITKYTEIIKNNYKLVDIQDNFKKGSDFPNNKYGDDEKPYSGIFNILDKNVYYMEGFIQKLQEDIIDIYCSNGAVKDNDDNNLICDSNDLTNEESYLVKYINNVTKIMKYFSDEIDGSEKFINSLSKNQKVYEKQIDKLKSTSLEVSEDLDNYQNNFLDKAYHYINISKSCGYILVTIYYSILLVLVIGGCFLLWAYSYLKDQQILITFMHIFWNILKFFIFSFFMFGAAFGVLYICARDLIGYNEFLFSNDNIGEESKTYLLPNGKSKEFLRSCLFDKDSNYLSGLKFDINQKLYNLYNNLKSMNSSKNFLEKENGYQLYNKTIYCYNIDSLRHLEDNTDDAFDSSDNIILEINFTNVGTKFEIMINESYKIIFPDSSGGSRNLQDEETDFFQDVNGLGTSIENYNCGFIKNEVQILYDALYELSVESRISCALCCCIGFFGEISVIFYLLVMYHYDNVQFNEGISITSKNITRDNRRKFDMESQNGFMDKTRPPNLKKNNKKLDLEYEYKL